MKKPFNPKILKLIFADHEKKLVEMSYEMLKSSLIDLLVEY